MTDRTKSTGSNLPALRPEVSPQPSLPSLPASSGAWLGTRKHILRRDREFIEAHTSLLRAKREQSDVVRGLVESRMSSALTMAKLSALPEIAEHEYQRGRSERRREESDWMHQERVAAIEHARDELDAHAALVRAQQRLDELQPIPEPRPSHASAPQGLTPADVEQVAQQLPELKPETVRTLSLMLAGWLAEKNK